MGMGKKKALDRSVFLQAIKYGLSKPEGFSYDEIIKALTLENWEVKILSDYINAAHTNAFYVRAARAGSVDTPFFQIKNGSTFDNENSKYIVSYGALFNYLDYRELKEAQKNAKAAQKYAKEAQQLSLWAIRISVFAIIASMGVTLYATFATQKVELNHKSSLTSYNSLKYKNKKPNKYQTRNSHTTATLSKQDDYTLVVS